jgi:rhodanese-related sulfurtransferase
VAQQLMKKGYSQVYALKGGWWDWEDAGYPMEPKNKK